MGRNAAAATKAVQPASPVRPATRSPTATVSIHVPTFEISAAVHTRAKFRWRSGRKAIHREEVVGPGTTTPPSATAPPPDRRPSSCADGSYGAKAGSPPRLGWSRSRLGGLLQGRRNGVRDAPHDHERTARRPHEGRGGPPRRGGRQGRVAGARRRCPTSSRRRRPRRSTSPTTAPGRWWSRSSRPATAPRPPPRRTPAPPRQPRRRSRRTISPSACSRQGWPAPPRDAAYPAVVGGRRTVSVLFTGIDGAAADAADLTAHLLAHLGGLSTATSGVLRSSAAYGTAPLHHDAQPEEVGPRQPRSSATSGPAPL